jgi:hypothetical protein
MWPTFGCSCFSRTSDASSQKNSIFYIENILLIPGYSKSWLSSLWAQVANIMNVSWGADHRALDGMTLARFNSTWKELVEEPAAFLKHLS